MVHGNRSSQLIKERILKPGNEGHGYYTVSLKLNCTSKSHRVHRLVAIAFLNNKNNLSDVNHIDGDRSNNRLDNLEWTSRRENLTHGLLSKNITSKHAGVHFISDSKKWGSRLYLNGNHIFLGNFDNELDAANKYKEALIEYNIINKYVKK